jgi:DNA invertase Pin-like site-specific DNA recombinase
MNGEKMKAVGYVRVSSEDQAKEGVSLENQKAKIQTYCKLKDMDLVTVLEDAGISARNLKRPGVQVVLNMVMNKSVDAVVVYKLDRMFRSTVDALETTKKFDKQGVAFHSIEETIDTKSAMGRFFFTLTAALAELERGIIGERTRDALQHKKQNGDVWGPVPYGFKRVQKKIVPDTAEQKVVQKIIHIWKTGGNYSEIARKLNSSGIKTKKGTSCWYPQTVKNVVLDNT